MGLSYVLPVSLGVSPTAASTPTGVLTQRFEALFPCAGALGCLVCFAPRSLSGFIYVRMWGPGLLPTALPAPFSATLSQALSVYLCGNVGPQGLLVVRQPAPLVPHSASLGPAKATQVLSALAACLRPSYWSGGMFIFLFPWCRTSLPFDFLSVLVVRGGAVCLPTLPSWFSDTLVFISRCILPSSPLVFSIGFSLAFLLPSPSSPLL